MREDCKLQRVIILTVSRRRRSTSLLQSKDEALLSVSVVLDNGEIFFETEERVSSRPRPPRPDFYFVPTTWMSIQRLDLRRGELGRNETFPRLCGTCEAMETLPVTLR